jgi:hypothetical protein
MNRSAPLLSRLLRGLLLSVVVASVACVGDACGDSRNAQKSIDDARLSGHVMVCRVAFGECSLVTATVTVVSVHGTKFGSAIAKEHALGGRFSFMLAPGKYFPSASDVQAQLNGGRCIAGEVVVHAHENVRDEIHCYRRIR